MGWKRFGFSAGSAPLAAHEVTAAPSFPGDGQRGPGGRGCWAALGKEGGENPAPLQPVGSEATKRCDTRHRTLPWPRGLLRGSPAHSDPTVPTCPVALGESFGSPGLGFLIGEKAVKMLVPLGLSWGSQEAVRGVSIVLVALSSVAQ